MEIVYNLFFCLVLHVIFSAPVSDLGKAQNLSLVFITDAKTCLYFSVWQMSSESLVFVFFCMFQHFVFLAFWIPVASVLNTLDSLLIIFFFFSFLFLCGLCYVIKITVIEMYPVSRCFVLICFLHGWPQSENDISTFYSTLMTYHILVFVFKFTFKF